MVHVDRVNRKMGNGSTDPLLGELRGDVSCNAVLKTKGNPQSLLALVNELVCFQLAKSVDLPVPDGGIAVLNDGTIVEAPDLVAPADMGNCFFSKYVERSNPAVGTVISGVSNKSDFEKVILFDHVVYNKDRSKLNLLVSYEKREWRLIAIDHTHVFKNQTIWNAHCLKQGMQENDYLDENIMESNFYGPFFESKNINISTLKMSSNIFADRITGDYLDEVIDSIPEDWRTPSYDEDMTMLKKYLLYRLSHIDDMCAMISKWSRR